MRKQMAEVKSAEKIKATQFENGETYQFQATIVRRALGKDGFEDFVDKYCKARGRFGSQISAVGFRSAPTPGELQAFYDFTEKKITFRELKERFGVVSHAGTQMKLGRIYAFVAAQEDPKKEGTNG